MNALVTGGAGFIGSHLVDELMNRGEQVFVIDDLSTGSLDNLEAARGERLHVEIARVEESASLEQWMQQVDVVFHLAAAVGVRFVIDHRVRTMRTNLQATEKVLDHASRRGIPVFLASTSEVYGASEDIPFVEDQPLRLGSPDTGRWGYAASKAMTEFLALAYAKERALPVLIARLFNTTGPRQTASSGMVLPTFVRQVLHDEPITVFGDGSQTRCFAHVSDVVRDILALMDEPDAKGNIFNIGDDSEIGIGMLARRVKELTGSEVPIRFLSYKDVRGDFEDMQRRVPDLRKIRSVIGSRPKKNLDEMIESVIEYTRRTPERGSPISR